MNGPCARAQTDGHLHTGLYCIYIFKYINILYIYRLERVRVRDRECKSAGAVALHLNHRNMSAGVGRRFHIQ